MTENTLHQDLQEIIYRFSTHSNRFRNLIKSFLDYDSELSIKIICHLSLTPEYKDDYIRLLGNKKEDLTDLAELLENIGKDLQEFGDRVVKNNDYYLEKFKELENK